MENNIGTKVANIFVLNLAGFKLNPQRICVFLHSDNDWQLIMGFATPLSRFTFFNIQYDISKIGSCFCAHSMLPLGNVVPIINLCRTVID